MGYFRPQNVYSKNLFTALSILMYAKMKKICFPCVWLEIGNVSPAGGIPVYWDFPLGNKSQLACWNSPTIIHYKSIHLLDIGGFQFAGNSLWIGNVFFMQSWECFSLPFRDTLGSPLGTYLEPHLKSTSHRLYIYYEDVFDNKLFLAWYEYNPIRIRLLA